MRTGALDRRVTVLTFSTAPNELNEEIPAWRDLATVACSFTPISDGERMRAGELAASLTARFQVRWSRQLAAVLDPTCRLRFEGVTFTIAGVKPIGRQGGFEITSGARAEK